MNSTHVHLLLNHFPIVGTLLGGLLLFWGIISKQLSLKTAAAILLVAMAAAAVPVYLTGEPAEEAVEKLPGVSDTFMELHEEAANIAIWLMSVTGIASLMALAMHKRQSTKTNAAFILACVLSGFTFAAMARTGYLGGKIRHSEIRTSTEQTANPASGEKDDDAKSNKEEDD
jgi:uncharacterized membrane protein